MLRLSLVLVSSLLAYLCKAKLLCPINHNLRLPSKDISHPESYHFLESSLTIFSNLRVPCTGQLKSWQFWAQNSIVYGVYLAVFRERRTTPSVFDLVGVTHIYEELARNYTENACWHSYEANPPIDVIEGDYLGVYYEKFKIRSEFVSISSLSRMDISFRDGAEQPSYILLMDSYDIDRLNGVVDARKSHRDYRKPALYAFFATQVEKDTTTTPVPKLAKEDLERFTTVRNSKLALPNPCLNYPSVSTQCWVPQQRSFYNIYQDSCEVFTGCPAGYSAFEAPNNFDNLNECILTCRPKRQVEELSPEVVPRRLVPIRNSKQPKRWDLGL